MAIDDGVDVPWDGSDVSVAGDLTSGTAALAQALARRFVTPRGSLFYDLAYGEDLRRFVGEKFSALTATQLRAAIVAQAEQDERVRGCDARVAYDAASKALTVRIAIDAATGPFVLVLGISAVTIQLLAVES